MANTKTWAESLGICGTKTVPSVDATDYEVHRSASEIANRTIVLHAVAATGYGVDPEPVVDWLKDQDLWSSVSPKERTILTADELTEDAAVAAKWRQEAQWTLLWAIRKIRSLGLPTQTCDTRKLVDDIMPALGDSIASFVSSAKLRPNEELLAEEDRVYNLHCYARQAHRKNEMPEDLIYDVLFQRHYAFEWLAGDDWDDVHTDT